MVGKSGSYTKKLLHQALVVSLLLFFTILFFTPLIGCDAINDKLNSQGNITADLPLLYFGNLLPGATSSRSLIISNGGEGELVISGLDISSSSFQLVGTILFPISLSSGENLEINLTFEPSAIGSVTALLSILSNDPDTPVKTVPLSGESIFYQFTPSEESLIDFGTTTVFSSLSENIMVKNIGTESVTLSSVSIAIPFSVVSPTSAVSLAPGESSVISVDFIPTSGTQLTETLSVVFDASTTVELTLTGRGLELQDIEFPSPAIFMVSSSSTYVIGAPNYYTAEQDITISNSGDVSLSINSFSIDGGASFSGTDASSFSLISEPPSFAVLPATISAGGSAVFRVAFMQEDGDVIPKSCWFTIGSSDPDEPLVQVDLSGIWIDFDPNDILVPVPVSPAFSMGFSGVALPIHTVKGISGFSITDREIPYEGWYIIRDWGEKNGYSFANQGRAGSLGVDGALPTLANEQKPVTHINYHDALVWCNALSEYNSHTPIYYRPDSIHDNSNVYKDSTTALPITAADVEWNADGFRLPSEAEWELSASWITTGSRINGDLYSASNLMGTIDLAAWTSLDSLSDCADTASRGANSLGLYDFSGNVSEFCFDSFEPYQQAIPFTGFDAAGATEAGLKVIRGGSYLSTPSECSVSARDSILETAISPFIGLRVVKRFAASTFSSSALSSIQLTNSDNPIDVPVDIEALTTLDGRYYFLLPSTSSVTSLKVEILGDAAYIDTPLGPVDSGSTALDLSTVFPAEVYAGDGSSTSLNLIAAAVQAVFVSISGSDDNGLGTQSAPFASISKALAVAQWFSIDEVRLSGGYYSQTTPIVLPEGISILGGYNSGDWNDRQYLTEFERDPSNALYSVRLQYTGSDLGTALDPVSTLLVNDPLVDSNSIIEGLFVDGNSSAEYSCGIQVKSAASPTLSYLTIKGGAGSFESSALSVSTLALPVVEFSLLYGGTSGGESAAVRVSDASPIIRTCELSGESGSSLSAGVLVSQDSSAKINNNIIYGGTGSISAGVMVRNITSSYPDIPRLYNNTIDGGDGATSAYGVLIQTGEISIINNIFTVSVAANGFGIYESNNASDPYELLANNFSSPMTAFYYDADQPGSENKGQKGEVNALADLSGTVADNLAYTLTFNVDYSISTLPLPVELFQRGVVLSGVQLEGYIQNSSSEQSDYDGSINRSSDGFWSVGPHELDLTPSNDADLSALSCDAGSFTAAFDPAVITYSKNVTFAVTQVIFNLSRSYRYSMVEVSQDGSAFETLLEPEESDPGQWGTPMALNLNSGDNLFDIRVRAEDQVTVQTYRVTITRESNDASLSNLILKNDSPAVINFDSAFDSVDFQYLTADQAYAIDQVTINAVPNSSNATLRVDINGGGWNALAASTDSAFLALDSAIENKIQVEVTSQDSSVIKTYEAIVYRQQSVTALSALAISEGVLDPVIFDPLVFSYATRVAFVAAGVRQMTLTPTALQDTAFVSAYGLTHESALIEVQVNSGGWMTVNSGSTSPGLDINVGMNNIEIRVKAEDRSISAITTLSVERLGSSGVTVNMDWPTDETITLNTGSNLIPKGSPLSVNITEPFDSYQWLLDSSLQAGETTSSITIDTTPLPPGMHVLTAVVMIGSDIYSKTLNFYVSLP